jgi:hypothetical protein
MDKIMKTFLKSLNKLLFAGQDASQARMELFVQSMNPTSAADVERIIGEYDRIVNKGGMYS